MTKNRISFALLVIAITVQLLVPAGFIAEKYDTLNNGTEYKFRVVGYDPYDAYRGSYVALYADSDFWLSDGRYGVISVGSDGFAQISSVESKKPSSGDYMVSSSSHYYEIPIDRYYTDSETAEKLESALRTNFFSDGADETDAYVTVRVKNGNTVVSGLYIGGVSAEEYVESLNETSGGEAFA